MWMINDFPSYFVMSDRSTSGYLACLICAENTVSEWLYKSKKICYLGHERFKEDPPPPPPTGQDALSSVGNLNIIFRLNYKNRTTHSGGKKVSFLNCHIGKII